MDKRLRFMTDLIEPLMVPPGSTVRLSRDHDPGYTGQVPRRQAADLLADGVDLLAEYQDPLPPAGPDRRAPGLAGTRRVRQGQHHQARDERCQSAGGGGPCLQTALRRGTGSRLPLAVPARPARAGPDRHLQPLPLRGGARRPGASGAAGRGTDAQRREKIWERRYREINDWERYLADNGIHIVKVMLNVSRREQAKRFLKRIDHPDKNWKFSPSDVRERRHWDEYRHAFDIMLSRTSTKWAPWYVVPADHKWFSRLATAAILVRALHAIDPKYPAADPAVRGEMLQARDELRGELAAEDGGGP